MGVTENMKGDYVIVGDTERFEGCLVCVAGSTYERAEEVLNRMLNSPTEHDKKMMFGHTNFRIEFVVEKYCWWNQYCD